MIGLLILSLGLVQAPPSRPATPPAPVIRLASLTTTRAGHAVASTPPSPNGSLDFSQAGNPLWFAFIK